MTSLFRAGFDILQTLRSLVRDPGAFAIATLAQKITNEFLCIDLLQTWTESTGHDSQEWQEPLKTIPFLWIGLLRHCFSMIPFRLYFAV